ncbi:PTS glucose transporter subunit IIA [Enterococcus montenegrensis]|uniref:PTS sugar transporter subunit IIA n=1 Tax=Enterococcus montenegrensis TaxID=3031993 RepID=UPI00249DF7B2|nr:PTS glucose transporter subunit IIA [Enterococcus montenegrensis]WHA09263.1 PTS glucose transporter subunit IIA [Enterococcus montenegrensis]
MFNFFKKNNTVVAPVTGIFKQLADLSDPVFSKGMMGSGFAIKPEDKKIVAPVEGIITSIFPTKHALGLKTSSGTEILLHIGIDTVELNGKGFDVKVREGQKVHSGELLMIVDFELLERENKACDVIVVFVDYKKDLIIPSLDKLITNQRILELT